MPAMVLLGERDRMWLYLLSTLSTWTTAQATISPTLNRVSRLGSSLSYPVSPSLALLSLLVRSVEMLVMGTLPTR